MRCDRREIVLFTHHLLEMQTARLDLLSEGFIHRLQLCDDTAHDDVQASLPAAQLRALSPLAWARYGAAHIAYVRPVLVNGQPAVAIHAADGTPIGAAPSLDLALDFE